MIPCSSTSPRLNNMVQCAVAGCENESRKTGKQVSYHRFPNKEKDRQRYKVWVEKCHRKYVTPGFEGKKWEPAKIAVICGLHFAVDAFEVHPIVAVSCNISNSSPRLKNDAIPTIFWYNGENAPTTSPSKLYQKFRPVEKKKMMREVSSCIRLLNISVSFLFLISYDHIPD